METLADAIGQPATDVQSAAWDAMDDATRRRTIRRLHAIRAWEDKSVETTAVEAAKQAGVGISRFYKMAADWRDTGSLDALGTIKAASRRRESKLNGAVVNMLQRVVPKVVAQNDDANVAKLVQLMVKEAGVTRDLPGKMKLREIVETELRRSNATSMAGDSVALDCCAITWARSPERPFCIFMVIDRGTRAVLGHHVGSFEDDINGYASAARDAMAGMGRMPLHWAPSMRALQIVTGNDAEIYADLVERMETDFGISAKRASTTKRFGKYLREIIGLRIGQVTFTPPRTETGEPQKVNGRVEVRSCHLVREMVAKSIVSYNAVELEGREKSGEPSAQLIDVLSRIVQLQT